MDTAWNVEFHIYVVHNPNSMTSYLLARQESFALVKLRTYALLENTSSCHSFASHTAKSLVTDSRFEFNDINHGESVVVHNISSAVNLPHIRHILSLKVAMR